MNRCKYCGKPVDPASRFCTACGKPVDMTAEEVKFPEDPDFNAVPAEEKVTPEEEEDTLDILDFNALRDSFLEKTEQVEVQEAPEIVTHKPEVHTEAVPKQTAAKKEKTAEMPYVYEDDEDDEDEREGGHPILTGLLVALLLAAAAGAILFMIRPQVFDPVLNLFKPRQTAAPVTTPVVVDEPTPAPEVTPTPEASPTPEATPAEEAAPTPTPEQAVIAETIGEAVVKIDDLNIRSGPSTEYASLDVAVQGHTYPVFESKDGGGYTWYRIGDGQWVADRNGRWVEFTPNVLDDD